MGVAITLVGLWLALSVLGMIAAFLIDLLPWERPDARRSVRPAKPTHAPTGPTPLSPPHGRGN